MSSRIFINVGLLATIVIVAAILMFTEDKSKQDNTIYVSDIDANTINKIVLTNSADEKLEFEKINSDWKITQPKTISANPDRIKTLLGLLTLPSATKLSINEVKLEDIGLEPAKASLNFDNYKFKFGATDAIEQKRYVLFENHIYLIEDRLYPQLNSGLHFYIDNRLTQGKNIQSIDINGEIYLASENPALIQHWQAARAHNITRYTEKETNGSITVTLGNGNIIEYDIISDENNLRLTREERDIEYHLLSTHRKELLKLEKPDSNADETE